MVFEWQTTGIIDKCKLSLTASQSCADAAWRLISHLSHFFSAAAILGGHADPYEVRAAKFMPLKVYTFAGEGNVLADGKVLADAEKACDEPARNQAPKRRSARRSTLKTHGKMSLQTGKLFVGC